MWGHYEVVDTISEVYSTMPMKEISEVEEKSYTSSLNICPEVFSRQGRGVGGCNAPPPPPTHHHPISQLIREYIM